jgi:hypothetical protein
MYGNNKHSPRRADLRIDRSEHSTWPTGMEELPAVGQRVFCTGGMASVVRILGRTGDGSRLMELRLIGRTAPPFHAAASNVLVEPTSGPGVMETAMPRDAERIGVLSETPGPG